LIFLPAHRNPIDQLAQRESWILVELMRAEQQRLNTQMGGRAGVGLGPLRDLADGLLASMTEHDLVQAVERRIRGHLATLSSGVLPHFPFVGARHVDDAFLARALQMLLSSVDDRAGARRLELSGLGYVNLLHIAVILAAIPDAPMVPSLRGPAETLQDLPSDAEAEQAAEEEADTFFNKDVRLTTVVIEEPEAHLHPQLQFALVRHLRAIVRRRRELQVILSTHSPEILGSCTPEEIVLVRRDESGVVCRALADLPDTGRAADRRASLTLRKARMHLDASRSAGLFAPRLAVVEGPTDAAVLRAFAQVWANTDENRIAFADALTIVVVGAQTGGWPVLLLARAGFELVERLAVLCDSDAKPGPRGGPWMPWWVSDPDISSIARPFPSVPTLEPSLVEGNEALVMEALGELDYDPFGEYSNDTSLTWIVTTYFKDGGGGRRRKAAFAHALISRIEDLIEAGAADTVAVPKHISALLDYLYHGEIPDGFAKDGDLISEPEPSEEHIPPELDSYSPEADPFSEGVYSGYDSGYDRSSSLFEGFDAAPS
jgi:putative ATP-dependent endonuclease of OLD family